MRNLVLAALVFAAACSDSTGPEDVTVVTAAPLPQVTFTVPGVPTNQFGFAVNQWLTRCDAGTAGGPCPRGAVLDQALRAVVTDGVGGPALAGSLFVGVIALPGNTLLGNVPERAWWICYAWVAGSTDGKSVQPTCRGTTERSPRLVPANSSIRGKFGSDASAWWGGTLDASAPGGVRMNVVVQTIRADGGTTIHGYRDPFTGRYQ